MRYNDFWAPGDNVYYRTNEVCSFCEGTGVLTGKSGQVITCPVCNGESPSDERVGSVITFVEINTEGVFMHMENGDVIAQRQLLWHADMEPEQPNSGGGGEEFVDEDEN